MEKKTENLTELTPEQMNQVFGGAGGEVRNIYNTGDLPIVTGSKDICPRSHDGKHEWHYDKEKGISWCLYCKTERKR